MLRNFSKEYKQKLDIENKKIQEHIEAKYRDDLDSLNVKFSQNEKKVEEQNLKIISLKEEIKTYIDKIKSLEENKKEDIKIEEIKEESKVLPLTTFDFYHKKTGFFLNLLIIITLYIICYDIKISSYNPKKLYFPFQLNKLIICMQKLNE